MATDEQRRVFKVLKTFIRPYYDPDPISGISKFDFAILELEPNESVPAGVVEQMYTGEFTRVDEADRQAKSGDFLWVAGFPSELAELENRVATLF